MLDIFHHWTADVLSRLKMGAKILELGSASGVYADYIESNGFKVLRSDVVPEFVDYMRAGGHEAILLDALNDELGTELDLVFANAVLLHFTKEESAVVMQKVFDALSYGGVFAFSLKRGEGEEVVGDKIGAPRYFNYWEETDVISVLKDTGFQDVKIELVDETRGDSVVNWILITATK